MAHLSEHFNYKKLLIATLPTIMMMVFTSVYGIVDGLFVSNFVGESAFTAINLIMPFLMIIAAVGFMFGAGGSALAAKTMGEGDRKRANEIFSMTVYFTLLSGVVISVLAFLFIEPIAKWLGGANTSGQTIENAVRYGRILIGFHTAYMVQNVFQSFFVTAERATMGFIVTVAAGLTNIILDALFVAVFRWGIVGAAVATGISQTVGAVVPVVYFAKKNGSLLRLIKAKLEFAPLFKACTNGSSELLSNIAMSVMGMLYNMQLLKFAGGERGRGVRRNYVSGLYFLRDLYRLRHRRRAYRRLSPRRAKSRRIEKSLKKELGNYGDIQFGDGAFDRTVRRRA